MENPCRFRNAIDHSSQLNVRNGKYTAPIQGIYEFRIEVVGTNTLLQGPISALLIEKNGGNINSCGVDDTQDNGSEQYACSMLLKLEANDKIRLKVAMGTIKRVDFNGKYVRPF